ncbi:hypothetical protein JYP46_21960 [Nitratireductor aquimarinus]|uniref:hypothetical protein n=1 Tax=Alphaproteobacteria TaxID=28211 RepID=UPI0019D3A10B|nr:MULTISPECIES: hypothetical protein [Alphaproteobacteria]MBN7759494.1 hypothetical protein [Nitratireductor aquimarinus]MBY6002263.1 hypothetical protein [Tritonibacter mobilis]MBY6024719.1 hypothetical protein [Nitratireductor sp. DP7N14-4]
MKGLEASIASVQSFTNDLRIDAQFFRKAYLSEDQALHQHNLVAIGNFAFVTDGPHGYHEVDEQSPIAMLTAKCAANWFADRKNADTIAKWVDDTNKRSSLVVDDIILSTRGTVGKCALVTEEALPANLDQDVARIALNDDAPFCPAFLIAYLNCRFGQDHIERHSSGMVQQGLSLAKVRAIPVPELSQAVQMRIADTVQSALDRRREVAQKQTLAEETLLAALGLADWTPPEPLSYSARASDAFAAGRLDARFFAPRIQALLDILGRDGRSLGDLARPRRQKFRPQDCANFNYIEIGDIDDAGAATSTPLPCDEAPSRATWHVRPGDIITSTVRPIRRLSAQIAPEQDGYVASSGFVVIDPCQAAPELLLTFLRLPVICELLDLYGSASMYPAITDAHIFGLPFPQIDAAVETQIVANIRDARKAKAQAAQLLEAAKRAVEIAIEDGESAALDCLDSLKETS